MKLIATTNLGAALAAVVWMSSSVANAQNYYRDIPIGDRAIGMGGAYTGLADDPSAAYYNPAGLMRRGRPPVQRWLASLRVEPAPRE